MNETYMAIALKEAKKGIGYTSPNPAVGAVIVKNSEIIGKGYHKRAGSPHAEINALNGISSEMMVGATMYVTLEPCSHTGKTPPCCEAIVRAGITKVVIGMTDPNPIVNGKGISYLLKNGVEVVSGVLQKKCEEINYPFIKYITTGLPWVIMKAGVSLDGRLNYQRGQSGWITGTASSRAVHKMRNQVDAILIGRCTAEIDDPSLTARITHKKAHDPTRIVLDGGLSLSSEAKIFHLNSLAETWVVCGNDVPSARKNRFLDAGVKIFTVERHGGVLDLKQLLKLLGELKISSLLVEGGAQIHGAFLREQLIDFACLFYGPLFAGDKGVSLVEGFSVAERDSAPRLVDIRYQRHGEDMSVRGKLQY